MLQQDPKRRITVRGLSERFVNRGSSWKAVRDGTAVREYSGQLSFDVHPYKTV